MAGAGYKLFNTGDVLTAAQVNTYLMEQTVMVFADAAARTTALSGVVAEGMLSYLKSTKQVEVYNGSAWVASDDPNAIQNTIVDAKGDLITATAADTPARLAVGSNGDTLVADSAATTGLRYNPLVPSNFIINGTLDHWQRGTTFTSPANGAYTADRWSAVFCSSVSRSTDVPTGFTYSIEFSGTSTTPNINYRIESADATLMNNQSVTLSFWAKGTSGSTALAYEIYTANAKDDFSGLTLLTTANVSSNPANSWTRYTATFTATSVTNGFQIRLVRGSGTTTTRIAGVQLEIGSVATAFKRAGGGTIQGELAACQRYYWRANAVDNYSYYGAGQCYGTFNAIPVVTNPVPMRVKPTSIDYSNLCVFQANSTAQALSSLTISGGTTVGMGLAATATAGNLVVGNATLLVSNNTTNAYLGFSAEL